MEFYTIPIDSDVLYHHGVKGMKWGVRKKIDESRYNRAKRYAVKSAKEAATADRHAANKANGSFNLERSDRYSKKAARIAARIKDDKTRKAVQKDVKTVDSYRQEVGKNYVKRSAKERVAIAATSTAVSAGIAAIATMTGMPYSVIYVYTGSKYKLKEQ